VLRGYQHLAANVDTFYLCADLQTSAGENESETESESERSVFSSP